MKVSHELIARFFGDDRGCGNRLRAVVPFDDRFARKWRRRHFIPIDEDVIGLL